MHPCVLLTFALASLAPAQLLGFSYFDGAANVPREFRTTLDVAPVHASGTDSWAYAFKKAQAFVAKLNISQKVELVTNTELPDAGFNNVNRDGPSGVRGSAWSSAFPVGLTVAAMWDKQLFRERYQAHGKEFANHGYNHGLALVSGPNGRIAQGGRTAESWGPDPYLNGVVFENAVLGFQSAGVVAQGKHFIGNEQETYRLCSATFGSKFANANCTTPLDAFIPDQAMHEIYTWPWAKAVKAGLGSVMCSYNLLNGTRACENSAALQGILKGEFGFQGFVGPDYGALDSVASAMAGVDAGGNATAWGRSLLAAVTAGNVTQARLDDMAVRLLSAFYKVNANLTTTLTYSSTKRPPKIEDYSALIRKHGAAGTVLLKNQNHTLPLKAPLSMAVFGWDSALLANGPTVTFDFDNGVTFPQTPSNYYGTLATIPGSGTASFPYLISPLSALQAQAAKDHTYFTYVIDPDYQRSVPNEAPGLMPELDRVKIAIAGTSTEPAPEVCIVFVNSYSGEGADRMSLADPEGDALILRVADQCANTVVVLHSAGAYVMEPWIMHENVTAVVFAGLPGQESGNAITDILYGVVNPSGRLPLTIAKSEADYGTNISTAHNRGTPGSYFEEGIFVDYRHFDAANIEPRYEFGFGLSYTSFTYHNLKISCPGSPFPEFPRFQKMRSGGNPQLFLKLCTATVYIKNIGARDGHEVPQLYVTLPAVANHQNAVRQLRGFERIFLRKGAGASVKFELDRRDLSHWDALRQEWHLSHGVYKFTTGPSSRVIGQEASLQL